MREDCRSASRPRRSRSRAAPRRARDPETLRAVAELRQGEAAEAGIKFRAGRAEVRERFGALGLQLRHDRGEACAHVSAHHRPFIGENGRGLEQRLQRARAEAAMRCGAYELHRSAEPCASRPLHSAAIKSRQWGSIQRSFKAFASSS